MSSHRTSGCADRLKKAHGTARGCTLSQSCSCAQLIIKLCSGVPAVFLVPAWRSISGAGPAVSTRRAQLNRFFILLRSWSRVRIPPARPVLAVAQLGEHVTGWRNLVCTFPFGRFAVAAPPAVPLLLSINSYTWRQQSVPPLALQLIVSHVVGMGLKHCSAMFTHNKHSAFGCNTATT